MKSNINYNNTIHIYYHDITDVGIVDLKPDGATLKEKFLTNRFEGRSGVALRIARTNHACRPNAATIYDDTALVAILFSQRDIQAGEEITICYYISFFGYEPYSCPLDSKFPETNSIEEELSFFRYLMSSLHGITCPSDCFCYDPAIPALVREGRQIHSIMMKLANENKIEEALAAGDKLVDIHRHLNVSWLIQVDVNYNLFRVAVMKSKTLPRAKEYIRSAAEVFRKICPYSEKLTKSAEKLLDHPETDPYYLRND